MNQIIITGIIDNNDSNISKSDITIPMLTIETSCPLADEISFFKVPAILADKDIYRYLYFPIGTIVLVIGDLLYNGEKFYINVKQIYPLNKNTGKKYSKPKLRLTLLQNETFINRAYISGKLSENGKEIEVDCLPPRGQLAVSNRLPLLLPETNNTLTMSLTENGLVHIGELV